MIEAGQSGDRAGGTPSLDRRSFVGLGAAGIGVAALGATAALAGPSKLRVVSTPRGAIAYQIDGERRAGTVPLVLLQRFRGTMDDWDPAFIAALAEHRQVIRFDNAGVGRSTGAAPDSFVGMAQVAADLIAALKIPQVDALGWSMGGYIVQELGLLRPGLVRRMIVAASSCGDTPEGPKSDPRVPAVAGKPVNDDADFLFLFFRDTPASQAAGRADLARIHAASTGSPLASAAAVQAQVAATKAWKGTRTRLAGLTMPILVANGTDDIMIPSYGAYVLSHEAPNAKLLLYPNAAHGFLFQYIPDFTAEVDKFLTAPEAAA